MKRLMILTAVVTGLAAGVAVPGFSGGVVEPATGWASDADALPTGDLLEPRIVERPELVMAGVVASGPDVLQMDFHGLWMRFESESVNIKHHVEGAAYELHVQTEAEPAMHFTMAGVEITKIEDLPAEVFVKVVPAAPVALANGRPMDHSQEGA